MTQATPNRPTLCIGVLTLNEERRIRQCLESARFADRVLVIDSGSSDRTREIALEMGAEVHNYPDWQGFAVQRNRMLEHCVENYVFFLDADEVISPALRLEIEAARDLRRALVGEIYWQEIAFGKPIINLLAKKSVVRFFSRQLLLRFEGLVHEGAVLSDPTVERRVFRSALLHYSRETVHDSLRKLTQYSMLGAAKRVGRRGGVLRGLASALPMFVRLYFVRASFLSGGPGFLYAFCIALECFFRYAALHYDRDTLQGNVKR
jgi:glycosyltransferase involved in cell wall biosynthesis